MALPTGLSVVPATPARQTPVPVESDEGSVSASLRENLQHLPIGTVFALFAPFPWSPPRTLEQVAVIPEMILWYLCLIAAVVGFAALLRRRDFRFAMGVATASGILLILALIEANTGTLVRSRDMLVPYVVMLAAVGFETMRRAYQRR